MNAMLAASWGFRRRRLAPLAIAGAVAFLGSAVPQPTHAGHPMISVVVRKVTAGDTRPERMVEQLGGDVRRALSIINGFSAEIPAGRLSTLESSANVLTVTRDRSLQPMHSVDGFDAGEDPGSMHNTTKFVRAQDLWRAGIVGRGIDIAMIDSGVVPVNGLTATDKVVNGPDLSFESQADNLRYLDTFGHGTHMAGIIAGADNGSDPLSPNHDDFMGVAPGARLVSVKVASNSGVTDVSQVIAAIDWVVEHRKDAGFNIRVLNLSFGTDSTQNYVDDPLAYAAEVAWRKGIVVVVAAGNGGEVGLSNPASDPFVIAVGANNPHGTRTTADDTIPVWSARGDGQRDPDVVAPGRSIASLRNPGSNIDTFYPEGRINNRFFRGSGTSQAAAVVAGGAALLLQQRPSLSPDQVKDVLMSTANAIPGAPHAAQGEGLIDLRAASSALARNGGQPGARATGYGSLERARGSSHVSMDGVELTGERDIFGADFNSKIWAAGALKEANWSGGIWNGNRWAGDDWAGSSWSSSTWSSSSWSSSSWSGSSWSSSSWSGTSWSGSSWSSSSWSPDPWTSTSWSSSSWTTSSWG